MMVGHSWQKLDEKKEKKNKWKNLLLVEVCPLSHYASLCHFFRQK
jgi:hypothetical protein